MSKDTGGSAFPIAPIKQMGLSTMGNDGMSLRDYFAAKGLPSAINAVGIKADIWDIEKSGRNALIAKLAYELADAMLEARK